VEDFGDFGNTLIILIPLILIILFNVFFKKRKTEKTQPEIAMSLLSEVVTNQQIAEGFLGKTRIRKFRTDRAEEFNRAVDATRKFKSSSYLEGISADRLKESLARSRQGLEAWFETNKDQAMTMPGRRGCLSP